MFAFSLSLFSSLKDSPPPPCAWTYISCFFLDDGSYGDGDEGKFGDDARESEGSSATGVRSRARVLAQQREIQVDLNSPFYVGGTRCTVTFRAFRWLFHGIGRCVGGR